ncbi:flagellin, partial [Sporanaerobium hydrogeniformans]
ITFKQEASATITDGVISAGTTAGTDITIKYNALATSISQANVQGAIQAALGLMSTQSITIAGATTDLGSVFTTNGTSITASANRANEEIKFELKGFNTADLNMVENLKGKVAVTATDAIATIDFTGKDGTDVVNQSFNFKGTNYIFTQDNDAEDTESVKYINLNSIKAAGVPKALKEITATELADALANAIGANAMSDKDPTGKVTISSATAGKVTFTAAKKGAEASSAFKELFGSAGQNVTSGGTFKASLQVGANEGQMMAIEINDMRAQALGLSGAVNQSAKGNIREGATEARFTKMAGVSGTGTDNVMTQAALDITTSERATSALTVIDNAIKLVSEERSRMGAYQNRLEYTTNNLNTTSENLTAAESRIRDTDMAQEMMNYTKFNILNQAAQSMLAQANQSPQQILQLLQ